MARWRAEALERLPELQPVIASAETVMDLWTELRIGFEKAYEREPRDESLIARIYSFADWCAQAPRGPDAARDPLTAVTVAFHEHIPDFKPARDDMPRWFHYAEVAQNREVFSYLIGEKGYNDLLAYMTEYRHRYQPRPAAGRAFP